MKVILLRDVAKIGRRFEIVEVPDGFALNKLIPKKDAEAATPTNLKRIQQQKARTSANKAESSAEIIAIVEKLNQNKLNITTETNDLGHLFKAVNAKDIVKSANDLGLGLSEEVVIINEPIKSVGEHQIYIKNQDQKLSVNIIVSKKQK
jgi:large subunit ribosomal protein L9